MEHLLLVCPSSGTGILKLGARGYLRRAVAATGFSGRHLRGKRWPSKVGELPCPVWLRFCPHRDAGLPPLSAGLGGEPGALYIGLHFPEACQALKRKSHSGAKRSLSSLGAGLSAEGEGVTQEAAVSCPRSPGLRGLGPVASLVPLLTRRQGVESSPSPWVLPLSLG